MTRKPIRTPDDLSARDKAILDDFTSGTTRKALAAQHDVTTARIGQILHRPASVAYLALKGGATRTLIYAKLGEEILSRSEWGGLKLADLLGIWKAAMPQEVSVSVAIQEAARLIAERRGLTPEQTATVIELASRRKAP